MDTIIYRRSDQEFVGVVHHRRTPEGMAAAIAAEYQNTVNSGLGGVVSDYAHVEVANAFPNGQIPVISPAGEVSFEAPPKTAQDLARESRDTKLLALGLTQEELDA